MCVDIGQSYGAFLSLEQLLEVYKLDYTIDTEEFKNSKYIGKQDDNHRYILVAHDPFGWAAKYTVFYAFISKHPTEDRLQMEFAGVPHAECHSYEAALRIFYRLVASSYLIQTF